MSKYLLSLLALLLLASSVIAQPSLTTDQWREDLRYLSTELPKRHKNAFHTVTKADFDAAVRELDAKIPNLQSHEVLVGIMRVVAMVGDAHTELSGFGDNFHRFPLNVYWFRNELRVTRVSSEYKEAAGAKVIKIGDTNVNDANARLEQLAPHENVYWVRLLSSGFAVYAEILHALKLIPDLNQATWTFEDDNGKQFALQLNAVGVGTSINWVSASPQLPLYRQRPEEQLWSTFLPETQTVYVNFRGYREKFDERSRELLELIRQKSPQRVVIDMRQNRGGDFTKVRNGLLPGLKTLRTRPGSLYVITGRATQSAAVVNAIDFRKELRAVLVGEPTGGRPNGYSEHGEFKLPNSKLTVSYSSRYYKFQDTDTDAVMPDKLIEPDWPSYKSGRDPVMEWIIAQPVK